MAKTIEKKNVVKRKPGRLYFVDANGSVCSTPMKRKASKKAAPKKKAAKKKVARKKTASKKKAK